MAFYLEKWVQPAQTAVEYYIPGIPKDAVCTGLQSSIYSFTVSIIVTKGNCAAGVKSGFLALFVSAVYALALAFFSRFIDKYEYESLFLASTGAYLVSEAAGCKTSFELSFFATAILFSIQIPLDKTPIFGIIVV